jgi:prepilin-type N-terminal cleavage/methylation domain-containing protein
MRKPSHGFSLVELMTAIAVLALLLAVGVPNFRDAIRNSRMTSAANDLLAHAALARSEAIKRRAVVSVCSGEGGDAPSCDGGSFGSGWIVFEDANGDGDFDAGDELISEHAPLPGAIQSIVVEPGFDDPDDDEDGPWDESLMAEFSYAPSGFRVIPGGALPPTLSLVLCDERGNVQTSAGPGQSAGRIVEISAIGRAAVSRDVDAIDTRGGCPEA